MTIFRNFKNQSALYDHIWYHVSRISINSLRYFSKRSALYLKIKERVRVSKSTNTFKFEVISESRYGQYKIKCLQNSFARSL